MTLRSRAENGRRTDLGGRRGSILVVVAFAAVVLVAVAGVAIDGQ